MKSPYTGGKVVQQTTERTLNFRGDEITIPFINFKCVDTGKEFTNSEIDNLNLELLHNAYRELHNIPFPDEIKALREKYDLSKTKISEILGLGVNTYSNYENGEVPQLANAKFIRAAMNEDTFEEILNNSETLDDEKRKDIFKRYQKNTSKTERYSWVLKTLLREVKPGIKTGFRMPALEKFAAMVSFLTQNNEAYTVKLNKLLFYTDATHFKRFGHSISGIPYQAIRMGPVPYKYGTIFDACQELELYSIEQKYFEKYENTGDIFKSKADVNYDNFFSKDEIDTLSQIESKMVPIKTITLIELSHQELAWKIKSKRSELIDFRDTLLLKA